MWLVCQFLIHRYQVSEGDLDEENKIISVKYYHKHATHLGDFTEWYSSVQDGMVCDYLCVKSQKLGSTAVLQYYGN